MMVKPNKKGPARKQRKKRRNAPPVWRRCNDCQVYADTFGNYTTALIAALTLNLSTLPIFHTNQDGGVHFSFA